MLGRVSPNAGSEAIICCLRLPSTLWMMEQFARRDVLAVLARFDIEGAQRVVPLDPTEEVFLISAEDFARIDPNAVSLALMDVLPHTKVAVAPDGPGWRSEPI